VRTLFRTALYCLTLISEDNANADPRSFAEEVDVVSNIPPSFYEALLSSKWKDRKDALDGLHKLLSACLRIKDAPELTPISKALAARMSDANINCVVSAASCIGALANGLMGMFEKHVGAVMPPMLERLKERKQLVTDALGSALDAVFSTVSLMISDEKSAHLCRLDDNFGLH
jgi:cytoskeleton-associated protein 5